MIEIQVIIPCMRTTPFTGSGIELLSFFFILYYCYTGFSKLLDYSLFSLLAQFQPVVRRIPSLLLWLFPVSELSIAGLLCFPAGRKTAFMLMAASLFLIILYRLVILLTGQHLPCLCGPLIRKLSETRHLVLNGILFAGSLAGLFLTRSKTKPYSL
jgi:hypothetical protein